MGHFRRSSPVSDRSGVPQQPEARSTLRHVGVAPTADVVLAREQTISVSQKLLLCDPSMMGPPALRQPHLFGDAR
jgi:hypothetical protein